MSENVSRADQDAQVASGTRLRCRHCRAEAIVTRSGPATLRCCGDPLEIIFAGSGR